MNDGPSLADLDLSRIVTITGAGFSKHVSSVMPVMGELATELAPRLLSGNVAYRLLESEREALAGGRVPMGNVEAWLTALATRQPFHSASEQLRRRALFLEVAKAIADVVADREKIARASAPPRWLKRLVTLWHHLRASVLTFNYDTLIESASSDLALWGPAPEQPNISRRAMPRHIIGGFPPLLPRPGMMFGEEDTATLQLCKLHGSLNWWGRPEASDLFAVVDGYSIPDWRAEGMYEPPMKGLTPFIVPPTADKSAQYGNGTIEAVWTDAAAALAEATIVVLFGYSLPATDTSAVALVAENLRPHVPIVIVDCNSAEVRERLKQWSSNLAMIVGDRDVARHGVLVDEFIDVLESAAAQRNPEFRTTHTGGDTHVNCYVEVVTSDRAMYSCDGVSDQHILAAQPDPDLAILTRPPGPPVDATQLLIRRSVRFRSGRIAPVYCFERTQNTSELSVIRVHTAPE